MSDLVGLVNLSVGGSAFVTEQPTRPLIHLPTGMVRIYPVRRDQLDDQIRSFPLTVVFHSAGELFWLMPIAGEPNAESWSRPATFDQEVAEPHAYAVTLEESAIRVEFAPTQLCGQFRFTSAGAPIATLLANRNPGDLEGQGDRSVAGWEDFRGIRTYFHGEFSGPVRFGRSRDDGRTRLAAASGAGSVLEFRYGISFISAEQARRNLAEGIPAWNLDAVRAAARSAWNGVLGAIEVGGGSGSQRRTFYTALARTYERRFSVAEGGRYFSGYDRTIHEGERPFYVHNPIWDSYRALAPLHLLIDSQAEADRLDSYVRMYAQSGWMPTFAEIWGANPCMNGNHAAVWFADAWAKGCRGFDVRAAYEGVRKNALEATLLPWCSGPRCALDDFYHENGFYPALAPGETESEARVHGFERRQSVAVTLEHSYDDWCIAQLARAAGDEAGCRQMLRRAAYYRNVYRPDKALMWPKDANGRWIEPFDPKRDGGVGGREYFDENTAYVYTWAAPHDYEGLFSLMGGRAQAESNLDQLFREELGRFKFDFYAQYPDSTGLIGQYAIGNEPGFALPFIYHHLGAPYKTQKRVRMILDSFFNDTLMGLPGDEDGGAMSAFAVFSMMGLYPSVAGVPAYALCSPVFEEVSIRLAAGRLRITAAGNSAANKYIQKAVFNGRPLRRLWLAHREIAKGGLLELQMGDAPNRSLGSDPSQFPPSALAFDPRDLF